VNSIVLKHSEAMGPGATPVPICQSFGSRAIHTPVALDHSGGARSLVAHFPCIALIDYDKLVTNIRTNVQMDEILIKNTQILRDSSMIQY
jgi:hypothetical protein